MSQPTPDETLLGLLAARPQHGYQLLEYFRDSAQLAEVWNLSTSQVYAVLKRLADNGFINGREVQSVDAPPRMEYSITPIGRERLDLWLHEKQPSASIRRVRVDFLSRLYIARLLKISIQPIVECQKNTCCVKLDELIHQREQSEPGVGALALDLVIAQTRAVLQWIDQCQFAPEK